MISTLLTQRWQLGASSETGPNKNNNEDAVYCDPENRFAIVCDGVGGNPHGELAAQMTCSFLSNSFDHLDLHNIERATLKETLRQCHAHLLQHMETHPQTRNMATTVVLAIQRGKQAWVAWAGDSRAYLISKNTLTQISHDHSFVNEKISQGVLTEAEAASHPMANLITSSLGGSPRSLQHIGMKTVKLKKHDRLVLCTDGVYAFMSAAELLASAQRSAEHITAQAIDNNTSDNCSTACIEVL
jgi:protein phosphatase